MRVCLFEDGGVSDLGPLTLTRPAFDLLCGCATLADKQRRHFAATAVGAVVRPELAEVVREARPGWAVNDADWLRAGPVVLVNARWLPGAGHMEDIAGPCSATIDGEPAFAALTAGQAGGLSLDDLPDELQRLGLPDSPAGGRLARHLWELVDWAGEEVALDAWHLGPTWRHKADGLPACVGPADRLLIDATARVEPMVIADTTGGPVVIDRDAVVSAFTRLEGPCYVGPGSHVLGAKLRAGTCLGPQCRVGGEVEASVILGHSNKYHEGFLGHAYLGEWVNLGAGTHNSDLRNDYGEVTVPLAGRPTRTGRTKVGCFLGDHTKAALGALLNTGTSVGCFCHLMPTGGLLPKYVPPFADVWNGRLRENTDARPLLETAAVVMRRRGRELTPALRALYESVRERTADERRRAVYEGQMRQLRRGA